MFVTLAEICNTVSFEDLNHRHTQKLRILMEEFAMSTVTVVNKLCAGNCSRNVPSGRAFSGVGLQLLIC